MSSTISPWRFCVAPMMDWTDRHCRTFHRQLSRHARLYTEMVTTGALLHGDVPRHLDFDQAEHPVALQIGGSDPGELAACARLGERWGYDEINLNCGCPSERVQRGAFGACLMAEPNLVADCIRAMMDTVSIPVTVKHRLGLDRVEDYGFVRDFVGALFEAGCRVFIVHARNAVLKGLSPKDNREVPRLRYDEVARLKCDFPDVTVVLNGGMASLDEALRVLPDVDGVMLGRHAYHQPAALLDVDRRVFGSVPRHTRETAIDAMTVYLHRMHPLGVPVRAVIRHMLGLYTGRPGARRWRQCLSDARFLEQHGVDALRIAAAAFEPEARLVAPT
jgi:tRNA-dihydrouridine synthase A